MHKKNKNSGSINNHTNSNSSDLYDSKVEHRSIKDQLLAEARELKEGNYADFHGTRKSSEKPTDFEQRQLNPLLFMFKWAVLGFVFLVIAFFARGFLNNYNKNSAEKIAELEAEVKTLRQIGIERPIFDDTEFSKIPDLIENWKKSFSEFEEAKDLMTWDRRDAAMKKLNESLTLLKGNLAAQKLMAEIAMKNREYPRAINLLIHILNTNPNDQIAIEMLAEAFDGLDKPVETLKLAEWGLENDPRDFKLLNIASESAFELENWPAAAQYYSKLLLAEPDNLVALNGAAALYFQTKEYKKALPYLLQVMDMNEKNPSSYMNVAICYANLGLVEDVVATLERASVVFGDRRMIGWTDSDEFDSIRNNSLFAAFAERISPELKIEAEQRALLKAPKKEVDIAPETPNLNQPILTQ